MGTDRIGTVVSTDHLAWTDHLAKKYIGAAAAIFDGQGRILLVKHSYGRLNWELPGGAAEAGAGDEDGGSGGSRDQSTRGSQGRQP